MVICSAFTKNIFCPGLRKAGFIWKFAFLSEFIGSSSVYVIPLPPIKYQTAIQQTYIVNIINSTRLGPWCKGPWIESLSLSDLSCGTGAVTSYAISIRCWISDCSKLTKFGLFDLLDSFFQKMLAKETIFNSLTKLTKLPDFIKIQIGSHEVVQHFFRQKEFWRPILLWWKNRNSALGHPAVSMKSRKYFHELFIMNHNGNELTFTTFYYHRNCRS